MKSFVEISLTEQRLKLYRDKDVLETFAISTAISGPGETSGSECTPRGRHVVFEKIGHGDEEGTVFVGRKPTGEVFNMALASKYPQRDWILTRIIRLAGDEPGYNQGGEVDTLERMIYIHGAPEGTKMGIPGSHGCIRMKNEDIVRFFELVEEGTIVNIRE